MAEQAAGQSPFTPVDELTHFIVMQEVRDSEVLAQLFRTHGGPLRQLLRSVVEHPEFREHSDDKQMVERYHALSKALTSRDVRDRLDQAVEENIFKELIDKYSTEPVEK